MVAALRLLDVCIAIGTGPHIVRNLPFFKQAFVLLELNKAFSEVLLLVARRADADETRWATQRLAHDGTIDLRAARCGAVEELLRLRADVHLQAGIRKTQKLIRWEHALAEMWG